MSHSKKANRNAYLAWKERTDIKAYSRSSFQKNKSKIYQRNQQARKELKDYIIVKYLRAIGWSFEDITPELIELKRQLIILNRQIKWQISRM